MSVEQSIATVLEKTADLIEAIESEKQAAVSAERTRLIDSIRDKVSETIGEDIPEDVLSKLSQADPEILATVNKLAERESLSLGEPSNKKSAAAPLSVDEQVKLAEERLVEFCVG